MKKHIVMGILSTMFGLLSCNGQTDKYESVDAAAFAKVIEDTAVVRLDVRTAEEYAEGHISGAVNIDVLSGNFESKALATLPADKSIALYCRSGNRSKRAANILADKGYKVIELRSGYMGWLKDNR